jgi:sugar phosphate isomerase/epimerase
MCLVRTATPCFKPTWFRSTGSALLRLRKEIGPIVGANLDPSHLFWMGADPLAAVDALGDAIHHAHAKDTALNEVALSLAGRLETVGHEKVKDRAWN